MVVLDFKGFLKTEFLNLGDFEILINSKVCLFWDLTWVRFNFISNQCVIVHDVLLYCWCDCND